MRGVFLCVGFSFPPAGCDVGERIQVRCAVPTARLLGRARVDGCAVRGTKEKSQIYCSELRKICGVENYTTRGRGGATCYGAASPFRDHAKARHHPAPFGSQTTARLQSTLVCVPPPPHHLYRHRGIGKLCEQNSQCDQPTPTPTTYQPTFFLFAYGIALHRLPRPL